MTTIHKLHEVVTACGNCFRGIVQVGGKDFTVECNPEMTSLQVIDENTSCMTCTIDEDGDVIFESGEDVAENWTDADWSEFTKFVGAK